MGRHEDLDADGIADQARQLPPDQFAHPDGTVYQRVHPDELDEGED